MLRLALALLFVALSAKAQIIFELPKATQASGNCVEAGGIPQSPPDPASLDQKDYVELSRSSCFGRCPDYRVRIYRTGRVEWEGRRNVEKIGESENQAEMTATAAIFTQTQSSEFWAACDSYRRRVTDNPTYIVTTNIGGETKSIADYTQGGPNWVRGLMQKIDEAAGSKKWVGEDTWHPIQLK